MGKSSSSYPSAPDPNVTAAAQGAANKETAIAQARLNQINEFTPFGSAVYEPTGTTADGIDQYKRTVTLSPEQQRILDLSNALSEKAYTIGGGQIERIGEALSTPLDFSGLPAAPGADEAARKEVQDALYKRYTDVLDPQFADERRRVETQLANQGFAIGSEGYGRSMADFERSRADAYDRALTSAIAGGGAEQSRLFGLEASARERALQEMFAERNQPINELSALLGTSGGINVPQFSPVPQTAIAGTDVIGPTNTAYQGQVNAYNQQQATNNATMGSLFGLAGTALGAWLSDEDAKTDKRPIDASRVLEDVRRMPVMAYRYKATGHTNMGPMAQDWAGAFGGDGETIEAPQAFGVSFAAIKALADRMDRIERKVA